MQVKVCNLRSNDFSRDFMSSILDTGFAVLTHHGIDHGMIREAQQAWREFFLSGLAKKNYFINYQDPNLGYKGMKHEKAVGASVPDLKEFFHWKPGGLIPGSVHALTQKLFYELEDISLQTLRVLDQNYTGPKFGFENCCYQSDNTILRTLYYPAMDFVAEKGAVRAAAHEDINFITLLVAASAAGLQVKDSKGEWLDVPHEDNSIVVNVGDMLQLASNGYYRSTTHRVVNPTDSGTDRISMPLFLHPHSQTLLADGITAKSYLDQRIAEIYQGKP